MKKKLLVIDFFGLFCPPIMQKWLSTFDKKTMEEGLEIVYKGDKGEYDYQGQVKRLARYMGMSEKEVNDAVNPYFNIDFSLIEFIRSIKDKWIVVLCSNAPKGLVIDLINKYNFDDIFDHKIISGEVKETKPDEHMFLRCPALFNQKFETIVMVDDSERNIEVCKKLGWDTVLYKNVDSLKDYIKKNS